MTARLRPGPTLGLLLYLLTGVPLIGCSGAALHGNASPAPSPGVSVELVQVRTADRVLLDGALWRPAAAPGTGPALFLIHGYAGNFYTGWPGLAHDLAEQGHPTLALNMRDHDLTPQTSVFEDNRADIEAGISLLTDRGAPSVILVGQSLGTNRVLFYQAETQDPRVSGIVLMAAPGNLLEWNIRIFGKERALAVLSEAQRRVREGQGAELMLVDLGLLGKALYSARHVVSLRGPETRSDPIQNIARIRVPILIFHGTADRLAEPAVAERLKASAAAARSVQFQLTPGADHNLSERTDAILPVLMRWLEGLSK